MHMKASYFQAVIAFVAVVAVDDDDERTGEENNVLSGKSDIGIADYGSDASFHRSSSALLSFLRYGKMPLSAVVGAAAADNEEY